MLIKYRRFSKLNPRVSCFESPRPLCTSTASPISRADLETLVLCQYRGGQFHDLLRSVISTPPVLLAACQNLVPGKRSSDIVSIRFPVDTLALSLQTDSFDVGVHCVRLHPSRKKGESLILSDLHLKVVTEAVRMVLEVVYDSRFATFSYGGRVSMGRHTAIRYLKSSVQNPNWWFRVHFHQQKFNSDQVQKLVSIMKNKIEDQVLINLIVKLFEFRVVDIELGGFCFGRGFPQESGLNSILVNIYFNGLDKDIQNVRLNINEKHSELDTNDIAVFHKPVRVYAVRYLDEILVITSGSKVLMSSLKDRVVNFLERELEVKVDKLKTALHSATLEKIDFLGMEIQAVSPMVLHPPMSEKAMRAQKKYLKMKEMKALELKNARETIRKKLGMKILNHLFKKLKRMQGFQSEASIETEVSEMFRMWANDVVEEFFRSQEDCWNWHWKLSSGDFFNIRKIRDQLPEDLVNAYDEFQEKVVKYMQPKRLQKALREEQMKESVEMQKYDNSIVEDLTKLCMKVIAPMNLVRNAVKMAGFTNSMGRPRPIKLLIPLEDVDIIKWYAGVGRRWLNYFCCCRNFKMVKTVVNYHLRFSCILTLAEKHESKKVEAIRHYTKDLKVVDANGMEQVYFPTEREIKMMGDKSLSDPIPVDGALCMSLIRLASDDPSGRCVAHFCDRTDTILYRVRLLQNRLNVDPQDPKKWVMGMGAIHESLNRKCLPLCTEHISNLYLGNITLQDIDCASCVDVL
ncbi:nuclear intron maturase 3, mitochondrial [Aristolochia californica]|uniref:nuclear intron maturase 3, mitochondrial n=1 Tax=Aristolochia californica TaxID=171875 RepID=UPI0035DF3771